MPPSTRRRTARAQRWKAVVIWSAAAFLVLLVVGFIAVKASIAAYLRGEKFRRFVSEKCGETLRAECDVAPFTVAGTSFFSDGLRAHGSEAAWFSELRLDQLRAEVSARRFFERVWQIDQVTVQRFDARLGGPRVALAEKGSVPVKASASRDSGWLPNRVEVSVATIREASLSWGETPETMGALRDTALEISPRDGGWKITGRGGRISHGSLPPGEVAAIELLYRGSSLFVQSAELRPTAGGSVKANGEVRIGDALDLHAVLTSVPVTPLLGDDWRLRLHGALSGEIDARGVPTAPVLTGKLQLANGQLEALPVLDQIAAFTRLQQFRRIALSKAFGDFRNEKGRLSVANFVAESEGLIRIEGAFSIAEGKIDGAFQVGVTPASLQWLPGSQERVFTQSRNGYLWAPMQLSGPVAKPSEDLTPRLAAAAQGAVIDGVSNAVREGVKTGKDAVKGALDLLLPLVK